MSVESRVDPSTNSPCRITCFSDTFGIQSNNGVGRFLHDLQHFSSTNQLPFKLVIAGKGKSSERLVQLRAPSFSLPTYSEVNLSMPLEHQRRRIRRSLNDWQPDVFHLSTPGPFGCLGLSIAAEMKRPTVGIYHTDFPRYARALVKKQAEHIQANPLKYVGPFAGNLLNRISPLLAKLESCNSQFGEDIETVTEIVKRNFHCLGAEGNLVDWLAEAACHATERILSQFYSRLSIVVARSPFHQHELCKSLDIDPDKVRALQPGTDTEQFHPRFADRGIWAQFGIPEDAFVLLYVGRITTEKNIDLLLETWNRLQQKRQDSSQSVHLVCVGYGSETDKDRLRACPQTHVVGQKVGEDLSRFYASADLLVFPSVTETLGQVGLEAAASATALVGADFGGQTSYVENGRTGVLLPANEPEAWANKILELVDQPQIALEMGTQARAHIANQFSIEASLQSYWDIHQEAAELAAHHRRIKKLKKINSRQTTKAPKTVQATPLMVISDYHAGRRFKNTAHRNLKQQAFKAMLQLAADEDMDLVYGGDFGDHGANPELQRLDFDVLRATKSEILPDKVPVLVRGNHDYGYSDAQLKERLGSCEIHPSLIYFHESSRVLVTHGHILGLARTFEAIHSARSTSELERLLSEEELDHDLKPSVIAYDLANLIESVVEKKGLTGLSPFWTALSKPRTVAADWLTRLSQQAGQTDQKTWKLMASLLGSQDDQETARCLGAACGSWATIYGHTHEPTAARVQAPGNAPAKIVGNSGNINRKSPSCIVARFPTLTVYRFDSKSGKLKATSTASLEEIETLNYAGKFPRRGIASSLTSALSDTAAESALS